ncbi:MAG TPA: hypothetical protein VM532_18500 [Burkholderiales bacterium]|nr:hypothetical protein [Burkholderiales bacterium]
MDGEEQTPEQQARAAMLALFFTINDTETQEASLDPLVAEASAVQTKQIEMEEDLHRLVNSSRQVTNDPRRAAFAQRLITGKSEELTQLTIEIHTKVQDIVKKYDSFMERISRPLEELEQLHSALSPADARKLKADLEKATDQAFVALIRFSVRSKGYREWLQSCEEDLVIKSELKNLLAYLGINEKSDECLQIYDKVTKVIFSQSSAGYELRRNPGASDEVHETLRDAMDQTISAMYSIRRHQLANLIEKIEREDSDELAIDLDSAVKHIEAMVQYRKHWAAVSDTPKVHLDEINYLETIATKYQTKALKAKATETAEVVQDEDIKEMSRELAESFDSVLGAIGTCCDAYELGDNPPGVPPEERFVIQESLGKVFSDISLQCRIFKHESAEPAAQALLDRMINGADALASRTKNGAQALEAVQRPGPQTYADILRKYELTSIVSERVSSEYDIEDDYTKAMESPRIIEVASSEDEISVAEDLEPLEIKSEVSGKTSLEPRIDHDHIEREMEARRTIGTTSSEDQTRVAENLEPLEREGLASGNTSPEPRMDNDPIERAMEPPKTIEATSSEDQTRVAENFEPVERESVASEKTSPTPHIDDGHESTKTKAIDSSSDEENAIVNFVDEINESINRLRKEYKKKNKALQTALKKTEPIVAAPKALHDRGNTPQKLFSLADKAAKQHKAMADLCEQIRREYNKLLGRGINADESSSQAASYGKEWRANEKEADAYSKRTKEWPTKRALELIVKMPDEDVFKWIPDSEIDRVEMIELKERPKIFKNGRPHLDENNRQYCDHIVEFLVTLKNGRQFGQHTHFELVIDEKIPAETLMTKHSDAFVKAKFKTKEQLRFGKTYVVDEGKKGREVVIFHGATTFESSKRLRNLANSPQHKQTQVSSIDGKGVGGPRR